jgi:hypothetical protein
MPLPQRGSVEESAEDAFEDAEARQSSVAPSGHVMLAARFHCCRTSKCTDPMLSITPRMISVTRRMVRVGDARCVECGSRNVTGESVCHIYMEFTGREGGGLPFCIR